MLYLTQTICYTRTPFILYYCCSQVLKLLTMVQSINFHPLFSNLRSTKLALYIVLDLLILNPFYSKLFLQSSNHHLLASLSNQLVPHYLQTTYTMELHLKYQIGAQCGSLVQSTNSQAILLKTLSPKLQSPFACFLVESTSTTLFANNLHHGTAS